MVFTGHRNLVAPSQRLDWRLVLKKLNGFINSIYTLLGSKGNLSWSFEEHAIELGFHFLEVSNENFWVVSELVVQFKDFFIHIKNFWAWSIQFLVGHFFQINIY
jgi:hypothetical protein